MLITCLAVQIRRRSGIVASARAAGRSPSLTFYLRHLPPFRATPPDTMSLVGGLERRTFERSPFMLYARDAGDVLEPNATQRNTLIAAGVYILLIGILWYVTSRAPLERHSYVT